ncbi:nuclear transport factor 2 family protein [Lipingzhangella sp. LS1_29]|uniref:Nuclear transport factor 2 family protein n=1 Tax=Lipingzhangella rawalii TaxID=2055835 RepID=A0ABU2H962_9ACTN|nr:nuclear transport factor 2 family protein [Lipingzhangella rawalii]MDS1271853.1 nuclear transport factor 2 family protein [Lipingzhangella rawalii]
MTVKLPEPVASFIDAVNRHDENAFLNAFTSDGVVDDWGREFTGRQDIKSWSDREFIGASGVLTPESVEQNGSEVMVIGDWRSTYANGRSSFTFQTAGDRISRMTIREG